MANTGVPSALMTMTPPLPPKASASASSSSAAVNSGRRTWVKHSGSAPQMALRASIALSKLGIFQAAIRAQISRATVARMKYSPSPVADTAQPSRFDA